MKTFISITHGFVTVPLLRFFKQSFCFAKSIGFVSVLAFLVTAKSFGQGVPNCGCTANDVTSVTAELTKDAQGTPLTNTDCDGTTETAFLTFIFTANAAQRPGAYLEVVYRLNDGAQLTSKQCFPHIYSGTTKLSLPVNYHCGDNIEIVGMILAWNTGSQQSKADEFCQESHSMCVNVSPHCFQPTNTISVSSSLIAGFDVTKSCEGVANGSPESVTLNGKTTGGVGPYTFDWDLDGNGSWETLNQQSVSPPLEVGNHEIKIRVTDAANEVAIYTETITVETCFNMPVTYSYIKVYPAPEQGIQLEWQTTNEVNNNYFDVERSADGRSFKKVGNAISQPVSTKDSGLKTYRFTDAWAPEGLSYYRLKQVDLDGTVDYSKILSVSLGEGADRKTITISPNPVQNKVKIELISAPQGDFVVEIIDTNGRSHRSVRGHNEAEGFRYELDTHSLSSGLYLLSVRIENRYYIRRIIK